MSRIKDMLKIIRNGMAFAYSWLVICIVLAGLINGAETVSLIVLAKTFLLCLWGVIAFVICFMNESVKKKGFIFSLTLFYILFIPVEIVMFYFMGVFVTGGNVTAWILFGSIVVIGYVVSILIDTFIMKKKAVEYTEKMQEYVKNRK
ncbi:MAG: hypothetical protein J5517_09865 [Eubacterium sp.]|nr:hypothetical protein [Eubacterium sp.]